MESIRALTEQTDLIGDGVKSYVMPLFRRSAQTSNKVDCQPREVRVSISRQQQTLPYSHSTYCNILKYHRQMAVCRTFVLKIYGSTALHGIVSKKKFLKNQIQFI